MARLCPACQTTTGNQQQVCPNCGRNLQEAERAWRRGQTAWLAYLDVSGWYPGRHDEWLDQRLVLVESGPIRRPGPPQRLIGRYLGGHPALLRPCRVILTRAHGSVTLSVPRWWPGRVVRLVVPLSAVRKVQAQRTTENTADEAVVTAAIGGARTGPLGMALGAQLGRRRRVLRTVHVHAELQGELVELVFRTFEDHGLNGSAALVRIFQAE